MGGLKEMLSNRRNRKAVYSRAAYWDGKAVDLEGDAVSMWANNNLNEHYGKEQFALIEEWLPDVTGCSILDIGCGTGRMSRFFASRGARVEGFDFSANAIDIAQRYVKDGNPSYRVLSLFDLDDQSKYDIAISWGVVTIAATNRQQLLDGLKRVRSAVKLDARVVLLEPVHSGFLHRVLAMGIDEFVATMEEAGFSVREVRDMHFWPARLALAFVSWPRWITSPAYHLGQWAMRLPGLRRMGDYKAIYATVKV